jgi:Cu/Zn superoxide dismutase
MNRQATSFATSLFVICALGVSGCASGDDGGDGASAGGGAGNGAGGNGAATARAVAAISGFGGGTVTGTATFSQQPAGVTVEIMLSNCPDGVHPVHIHEGTSCADAMMQGAHWNMTRGEGIPDITCAGGTGVSTYTRMPTPAELAWSIGGDAATSVVNHAFVVHNNDEMKTRIGCGVIAMQ